jgi:hypothetical protein
MKIGIIAPTHKYYMNYIQQNKLDKNNYKYISRLEHVLGCRFDYVIELNSCWMDDIGHILGYLQSHDIKVRGTHERN